MTAGQIRAPTCIPLKLTPGNKQNIDDETPVELSCDTPNTTIFYSLNGEKPVPFDQKSRNTYTYHGAFLLTAGKRTIKSVAAYPDGRQSNIVTKVYWVTESNPVQDLELLSLDTQLTHDPAGTHMEDEFKRRILAESFRNNMQTLPPGGLYTANRAKVRTSTSPAISPTNTGPLQRTSTPTKRASTPNRQNKRRSLKIAKDVMKQVNLHDDDPITNMPNITFTKASDKCPECFTDKPPNPLSRYCHQCAHYLPPNVIDGRSVKCLHCHSIIPADLDRCVVCNARITSHHINLPTTEPIVCTGCKFKNPPSSRTCVVCEEELELTIKPAEPVLPTQGHVTDPNKRKCVKCARGNSLVARYCDWCGGSMVDLTVTLPCSGCAFQNPPLALYCGNCGHSLLPRERPLAAKLCWDDEVPETRRTDQMMEKPDPLLISTDTQTDGIFYKSARRLQAEEDKVTDNIRQIYKSRGLSVTKFSPGGGNWRQNVEHITNHIKVYSQLNAEYQEIIGKHMLGKVTMATLYKDTDEIHLSYVFNCKKNGVHRPATPTRRLKSKSQISITAVLDSKNKRHSLASTTSDHMSDILQEELKSRRRTASRSASESERRGVASESDSARTSPSKSDTMSALVEDKQLQNGGGSGAALTETTNGIENTPSVCSEESALLNKETKLRKSIRKKAPKDMHNLRIGKLNTQLLQEVNKEGDEQRVSRVLGQGADPNTRTSGGVSVLCLAAKNRHSGAVRTLVQAGADLNFTVPSTRDTPLHIAVQQGSQDIVKYLVEQGCKFTVPNVTGKTALDVARERHNQRAVQLFTANMGSSLLSLK